MIDHCVDLGVWCNEVINSSGRWSMARLVSHIVSDFRCNSIIEGTILFRDAQTLFIFAVQTTNKQR